MNVQIVTIIFTAALILVFATVSQQAQQSEESHADMVAHLNTCFRALDDLGQSFENAKRTREILMILQRRWKNRTRSSSIGSKRTHPVQSAVDLEDIRKRQRRDLSSEENGPGSDLGWIRNGDLPPNWHDALLHPTAAAEALIAQGYPAHSQLGRSSQSVASNQPSSTWQQRKP